MWHECTHMGVHPCQPCFARPTVRAALRAMMRAFRPFGSASGLSSPFGCCPGKTQLVVNMMTLRAAALCALPLLFVSTIGSVRADDDYGALCAREWGPQADPAASSCRRLLGSLLQAD